MPPRQVRLSSLPWGNFQTSPSSARFDHHLGGSLSWKYASRSRVRRRPLPVRSSRISKSIAPLKLGCCDDHQNSSCEVGGTDLCCPWGSDATRPPGPPGGWRQSRPQHDDEPGTTGTGFVIDPQPGHPNSCPGKGGPILLCACSMRPGSPPASGMKITGPNRRRRARADPPPSLGAQLN